MNILRNAYLENLQDDWVAIATNGHPVCRAETEDAVRRAVPDAALYLNAQSPELAGLNLDDSAEMIGGDLDAALELIEEAVEDIQKFDHDGDGKPGGSKPTKAPAKKK